MDANIFVSKDDSTFHLTNGEYSYIFQCLEDGHLNHIYAGKAVRPIESYEHFYEVYPRPMTSCLKEGSWESQEHTAQEYGSLGVLTSALQLRSSTQMEARCLISN